MSSLPGVMGSCCSCLCSDSIPDNHPTKFKACSLMVPPLCRFGLVDLLHPGQCVAVIERGTENILNINSIGPKVKTFHLAGALGLGFAWQKLSLQDTRKHHVSCSIVKVTNVDDEGQELGSGVLELAPGELVLHSHKRDAVRWPYLCLRRYGFDANLFSFESGRRCRTGQGIFAFKCSRAEEIFNLLQELMQCNSINVVEEPVVITRSSHPSERELPRSPQGPTSLGYTGLPNGFHSFPGESLSYSAGQHPSVSSLRHSSVGEDSTHPLLGPEEQSHTYVNTGEPEPRGRHCVHSLPEAHPPFPPRNHSCSLEDRNPQVFLQPGEAKFVLAPSSGCRRPCPQRRPHLCPHNNNNNECQEGCPSPQCVYENLNGLVAPSTSSLSRSKASQEDGSCCQRRSALLHYENLPALPPLWELQPARQGHEDAGMAPTPSPNGFSEAGEEEPLQSSAASQPRRAFLPRARRSRLPNVFSFDFPRPCPEPPRQLNYIQVELEPEPCPGRQEPRASPGARRANSYAIIDLKKTAAMSSLQRALPRDDGTSRKTRHNSTDLPL